MDPDQSKSSTEECHKCRKVQEENDNLRKRLAEIAKLHSRNKELTKEIGRLGAEALGKQLDNKNNKKK